MSPSIFPVLQDIEFIEFQLAEQQGEDLPDTVTFEEWKADVSSMDDWFTTMDEKCSQVNISRDSDSLKKGEQDTKVWWENFILKSDLKGNWPHHELMPRYSCLKSSWLHYVFKENEISQPRSVHARVLSFKTINCFFRHFKQYQW